MDIKSAIKKVIAYRPPKWAVLLFIAIAYLLMKIYAVNYLPAKDDELTDDLKDAALIMAYNGSLDEEIQEWDLPLENQKL